MADAPTVRFPRTRANGIVLASMLGTGAIIVAGELSRGELPRPRRLLSLGVVYVGLAGLATVAPAIAAPFAGVVLVGTLLAGGEDAAKAIDEAVKSDAPLGARATLAIRGASAAVLTGVEHVAGIPAGPSSGGDPNPDNLPTGGPDSGRVDAGGEGGDWGGSMPRALQIAAASGLPISSQKRSRQHTASGGVSDHWIGSRTSYAVDLATTPATGGDAAYARVLAALGTNPMQHPAGRWHNIVRGGYRYQIGWRTAGHFDHIHVGVKRA